MNNFEQQAREINNAYENQYNPVEHEVDSRIECANCGDSNEAELIHFYFKTVTGSLCKPCHKEIVDEAIMSILESESGS